MRKSREDTDLRILEALGVHGPRNLAKIARELNLNAGSLRKRMAKHLSPKISLNANVYHANLGLRKCVVFADACKGKEGQLYEGLKAHNFWLYVSRCYGAFEGCIAMFGIPIGKETYFRKFLKELERRKIANKVRLYWSASSHTVNPTRNWYVAESQKWVFMWDKWMEELNSQKVTELPKTLIDPKEFPQKADYADVFILKELEKDATATLTDLGKKLDVTKQDVKYHYENHVIDRGLIENFQVISFPFDKSLSDFYFFTLWFQNDQAMAKFALSLLNKPFARSIGKVFGQNGLIVQLYLPRAEFREFVDRLSELCESGFLTDYQYVIQDWRKIERGTIPYELFQKRKWLYDPEAYLKQLDKVEKTNP